MAALLTELLLAALLKVLLLEALLTELFPAALEVTPPTLLLGIAFPPPPPLLATIIFEEALALLLNLPLFAVFDDLPETVLLFFEQQPFR